MMMLYLAPFYVHAQTSQSEAIENQSEDESSEMFPEIQLSGSTVLALKERRTLLRSWAPKCADGSLTMSECPFWDAVEYMGMLCLSGEEEYCKQVKKAQDETGRFWRSPGFIESTKPENGATFSRDMDRGVWAYIVASQDAETALKYMEFIKQNGYKLCPKSKENWDACTTRATFWTFAQEVFEWLELPIDKRKMKNYKFLIDALYSPIEAAVQPMHYEMILTAEKIYTLRKMQEMGAEIRNSRMFDRIAKKIHERDPANPFYDYLANGSTDAVAEKILHLCPTTKPIVPINHGVATYTEPGNGPWEQGSGHYCIFMINAVLNSAE